MGQNSFFFHSVKYLYLYIIIGITDKSCEFEKLFKIHFFFFLFFIRFSIDSISLCSAEISVFTENHAWDALKQVYDSLLYFHPIEYRQLNRSPYTLVTVVVPVSRFSTLFGKKDSKDV